MTRGGFAFGVAWSYDYTAEFYAIANCLQSLYSSLYTYSCTSLPYAYIDVPPRYKRGRYSDPGPRSREPESAEQKLESLITRVGEKVHTPTEIACVY